MTNSKDHSPENLTQGYHLAFSSSDDVSAELLRFFNAILEATRNTIKRENAALKRFRPRGRIVTTFKPPPPSTSHTSSTRPDTHSSYGEIDEHEGTE